MAFTAILRKSASALAPVAGRLVRGGAQRNYHSALFAAVNHHARLPQNNPSSVLRRYSTATADDQSPSSTESLLRVLESEIQMAREADDHDRVEEIPREFPFKIEDNAGEQIVVLTREYEGEQIKVEVHMPDLVTGEDNDLNDDDDDSAQSAGQSTMPLVVTVTKRSGTGLVFNCVAYPDEIAIDGLSITHPDDIEDQTAYEGPNFHELDENLRKAFHRYLELRGIKPSATNFLHEYMINKDSREYVGWLGNLKKFLEA
ncbi:hypothetical protein Tsubulata_026510 [Turnera subulata]|uniref:Mitochondrial glycoprotein n=1 Tax=Turnera subulata TaxID=218843 RepID=A0A9Q0G0J5_9ROSI|nr:hypothetical protein Tsubulata_026510 [Turnera subulata]